LDSWLDADPNRIKVVGISGNFDKELFELVTKELSNETK